MAKSVFPENFLWGASTSAFQIEGAKDKRGLNTMDFRSELDPSVDLDPSLAIDHYSKYKEDVKLMKELGLKSYRFSIAWSRIFPNGDDLVPNKEGVDFYHNLLDELISCGIEPIVTMYHFDYPIALIKKFGGWVSRKSIDAFVYYAEFLLNEYGTKVNYWLSINEQMVLGLNPASLGYEGNYEENSEKMEISFYHMSIAQAKVFKLCHDKLPGKKIGPALAIYTTLPESSDSRDVLHARYQDAMYNYRLGDICAFGKINGQYKKQLSDYSIDLPILPGDEEILKEGIADYFGINWYLTQILTRQKKGYETHMGPLKDTEQIRDLNRLQTDWGWNFDPVGLRIAMQELTARYPDMPLMITECGWSQKEEVVDGRIHDQVRIDYINDHVYQLGVSIAEGTNIIGFNPWSFIDLLSSHQGMDKRYGFVYVNRDNSGKGNLERFKKDSFYEYQKIIDTNGECVDKMSGRSYEEKSFH